MSLSVQSSTVVKNTFAPIKPIKIINPFEEPKLIDKNNITILALKNKYKATTQNLTVQFAPGVFPPGVGVTVKILDDKGVGVGDITGSTSKPLQIPTHAGWSYTISIVDSKGTTLSKIHINDFSTPYLYGGIPIDQTVGPRVANFTKAGAASGVLAIRRLTNTGAKPRIMGELAALLYAGKFFNTHVDIYAIEKEPLYKFICQPYHDKNVTKTPVADIVAQANLIKSLVVQKKANPAANIELTAPFTELMRRIMAALKNPASGPPGMSGELLLSAVRKQLKVKFRDWDNIFNDINVGSIAKRYDAHLWAASAKVASPKFVIANYDFSGFLSGKMQADPERNADPYNIQYGPGWMGPEVASMSAVLLHDMGVDLGVISSQAIDRLTGPNSITYDRINDILGSGPDNPSLYAKRAWIYNGVNALWGISQYTRSLTAPTAAAASKAIDAWQKKLNIAKRVNN